jgi:uncharacterized membrane protein
LKNSGLAVASLVLGITGIVFNFIPFMWWLGMICAVVGVILGGVGVSAINTSNGQLGGKGMAIAGIVLSIITLILAVLSMAACAAVVSSFQ